MPAVLISIGKALWDVFVRIAILMIPYFISFLNTLTAIVLSDILPLAIEGGDKAKAEAKSKLEKKWDEYLDSSVTAAKTTLSPIDDLIFRALKAAGTIEKSYIDKLVDFAFAKADGFFRGSPGGNPGAPKAAGG